MSWTSLALVISGGLSEHDLGLDRQLVPGQPQRLAGQRLGDARQLEHDTAGLDHGHPAFGIALARAHPRLGRLLGDRLVGIDVDPHLAPPLDLAGHRDPGRLDLAIAYPTALERLEAVLAELDAHPAAGESTPPAPVLLAVLDPLGLEHQAAVPPPRCDGEVAPPPGWRSRGAPPRPPSRRGPRPPSPRPRPPSPRPRPPSPRPRPPSPRPRPPPRSPPGGGALTSVRS